MTNWLKYGLPDFILAGLPAVIFAGLPAVILAGTGNHLVEMEQRRAPADEDDYARCDECGERTHIDFIVNRTDTNEVCRWCFTKMENEFFCNKCCEEFLFKGVPAVCPRCGSLKIWHEFTSGNILVKEQQREYQTQLETEQHRSAKILPFVPKATAQSTKDTNKSKNFTTENAPAYCRQGGTRTKDITRSFQKIILLVILKFCCILC